MRRYLIAALIVLGGIGVAAWLHGMLQGRFYVPYFVRLLTYPPVFVSLFGALGFALLCLRHRGACHDTDTRVRRRYAWCLCALLAVIVAVVVLANTAFSERSFGRMDRFVKLNGAWGTDRGRIWAHCMNAYRALPPLRKLFGGGPCYLHTYDAARRLFSDALLDAAHNEYLQYLLTVGVCGLAAYLGFLFFMLREAWRALKQHRDPMLFAALLGIVAYLAQATVGIAQPVSTPFVFVLAGLARGLTKGNEVHSKLTSETFAAPPCNAGKNPL